MAAVLFKSDYLQIYENSLKNHFHQFESNCKNFQRDWGKANKIFQRNFNECDCENAGIKDENFLRENYMKKLKEISNLMKLREDLKNQITKEKLKDDGTELIDTELIGHPKKRQNQILAQRVCDLEYSKHMAQKVIDELFKEAKIAEEKELDATTEMKHYESSLKTLKAQQKTIEDEINAEVQRIKKSFSKSYYEKWHYKRKYEALDEKIRLELNIEEKNVWNALIKNKLETEEIKRSIEVQNKLLKEESLLDTEFAEKCEFLEIDIKNKLKEIAEAEDEIKHIEKSILKVTAKSKAAKGETNKKLLDLKENSLVNTRINEIYRDNFGSVFEELEEATMKDLHSKEKIIKKLKNNICSLADQICQLSVIEEQLKADINFFMARDPKFVMCVDYMGGNLLCVNK